MLNRLNNDRKEFARLCEIELNRATELTGAFDKMEADAKATAKTRLYLIAMDMAEALPYSITNERVQELFRVARAHYARVPSLLDLQRAWDNHMKPQQAPAPKDAPRLPPPAEIASSEAQMRKLAAVRTSLAMGRTFQGCETEDWMLPLLELDPSRGEVEAMARASTPSTMTFYKRCPDIFPCWGRWLAHYGI